MYQRQSAAANLNRSLGYKKTASAAKTSGHKVEEYFATFNNGAVVATGQGRKTDVVDPVWGNCSVKAPKGGKVQMLLQVTENVEKRWGALNPITRSSKAQRAFYEDRHLNNARNERALYESAKTEVASLATWLNTGDNFREVLTHALLNDGEVDHIVDLYRSTDAYITPGADFIAGILALNPVAYQTASGLRVAVKIETGKYNRKGEPVTRSAFSFEVRSDKDKCKSLLYKMEGGIIFPIIRATVPTCERIAK